MPRPGGGPPAVVVLWCAARLAGRRERRGAMARRAVERPAKAMKAAKSQLRRAAAGKTARPPKPIALYYWPTPNGFKVSIMLEECRLAYSMIPVNIARGEQFDP